MRFLEWCLATWWGFWKFCGLTGITFWLFVAALQLGFKPRLVLPVSAELLKQYETESVEKITDPDEVQRIADEMRLNQKAKQTPKVVKQ